VPGLEKQAILSKTTNSFPPPKKKTKPKAGDMIVPDFTTYYKVTVTKTL
jgi:hypothetical protein